MVGMESKKQTSLWLTKEIHEWLRERSFTTRESQSKIIEKLLTKEMNKCKKK